MLSDEYVRKLSDESRRRIIDDYEKFRISGMIGDSCLRRNAQALSTHIGADGQIAAWMDILAEGCYRYYALKYLESDQ